VSDNETHASKIIENNSRLIERRSNWNRQWQMVGEYISQIKQDFEVKNDVGEFLNDDIYDSTGTFAATASAAAILGILYPSSAKKSIKITPPQDMEDVTDEEQRWYDDVVTKKLTLAMDAPSSNLILALNEYMLDQVIFGTSGIGVFWEGDSLFYKPFGVKEMVIDEGKHGRVDVVYINSEWDVKRVVDTYGLENVSDKVAEAYENNSMQTKVNIIIAYEPRDVIRGKRGRLSMPYASTHIEKDTKHVLREGGFEEFPIIVARFKKLNYEKYGRSVGMDALPDIKEAQSLAEAIIVATEKTLDPPLGLLDAGMLGGGVVDTSAGALTVFDAANNVSNAPPVFPINTVGSIDVALARLDALKQSISQHFFLDRLLDFNNEVQMTATETATRARIRDNSLSSLISRQVAELFNPLVERSVNAMLRADEFGVIAGTPEQQTAEALGEQVDIIPERIAQRLLNGEEVYDIRYTTPADRITNADELNGMIEQIQLFQGLMQTNPEAQAYLDIQDISESSTRLMGAPSGTIRSKEEIEQLQAQQQQQLEAEQSLNQAEQVAGIANEISTATSQQDGG